MTQHISKVPAGFPIREDHLLQLSNTLLGFWVEKSIPQINAKHATRSYERPIWGNGEHF